MRDVAKLAQLRSERLGHLTGKVNAVFPLTAMTGVPDKVRDEQTEHLLSLPDRVSIHLLPEGTLLLGIPGPFSLFRMSDGREIASSDHLEANAVYGDGVLPRVRELLRDAYALALPAMTSIEQLRRLS